MHSKTDSRPGDSPAAGRPGISSASDTFNLIAAGAYDAELRLIAEQAQMLTLANGAAIALRQGEFMVCRARSGATAPVLGARLDTQSGLSGECVRSARALVCDDTENDSRVNLDVCHYLGIRSIAVLPISLGREVVGVFEAFSAQPHGFSGNEVAALESMRDLVISVIRPSPQPQTPAPSALAARAAEDQPAPLSRRAENTPPPLRPPEKPPLAPFSPAITFDPEDDLLCELEQRAQPQASDPRTRAVQLLKAESPSPSPPPNSAPFLNPDPEDDLICEIEMRSAPRQPSEFGHSPGLGGFAPAPLNLREPVISRKLIAFAVVVVLSGVIWLRWCNHAPRTAKNAPPSATVEAASAAVPGPAAPPLAASKPESTPPPAPAANPAPAAASAPAVDTRSAADQPSAPLPPPQAQVRPEHPARMSHPEAKPARAAAPSKSQRASLESVAPMSSAPASAIPVSSSSLPAPAPPAPVPTQHQAVPAVSPPPPVSPPAFTLRPSPPAVSQSPSPGQLSLSQAVVTSAPQPSHADALSPDALRLLLDSATAGDAGAQLALAVRYADGEGVRQSYAEALKWFNRARAQGVTLSPGRVAEAWSKVQQWAQSHPEKR